MFKRYTKTGTRGFTLIELLVVIAIIGILSSVVLASLNTARRKSRDAQRVSDIRQIQLALEFYFDSNGNYPTDSEGIGELVTAGFLPATTTAPTCGSCTSSGAYFYDQISSTDYCVGIELEDASALPGNDTDCDADGVGTFAWDTDAEAYSTGP